MLKIILAAVMGLCNWNGKTEIDYNVGLPLCIPLTVGLLAGIIWGDPIKGLIIGGNLELIYIGLNLAPGGNWPTDDQLAGCIVVPLALMTDMDVSVACTLAVPIGLLGLFLVNLKKVIAIQFAHRADKYAEECNTKGIFRCAFVYPALANIPVAFLPVFITVMFGADILTAVLRYIPQFVIDGLAVAGGMLPAVGFAMIMYTIGKQRLIPWAILGFFITKLTGMSSLITAVLGICMAVIVVMISKENRGELENETETFFSKGTDEGEGNGILTKKDLFKCWLRLTCFGETSLNFERMQNIGFCNAMSPALEKLYPEKEDLAEALKRHLQFFNTQLAIGGMIFGTTLAMEELKSKNPEKVPDVLITNFKTGMMGPVAAFGDSLDWGTIFTLCLAFSASLAAEGNLISIAVLAIWAVFHEVVCYNLFKWSYRTGRTSFMKLIKSNLINDIMSGAAILGMFMIGALSANVVECTSVLSIGSFDLQATLDGIIPGILQLLLVGLCYWLIKYKKVKVYHVVVVIILIGILGSLVGLL